MRKDVDKRTYTSWFNMRHRCNYHKATCYDRYGGRGITICERWMSYDNFLEDMGERPQGDYSLDRIDNNGNYCKENCRWGTGKEQRDNRSNTKMYTLNGKTQTQAEWCRELGIDSSTIQYRLRKGMSVEEALLTKPRDTQHRKGILLTYKGETKTVAEWATLLNMNRVALRKRYYLGWNVEDIINTPISKDPYITHNSKDNNVIHTLDGLTASLSEWCRFFNANKSTVINRLRRGLPILDALTLPICNKRKKKEALK